MEESNTPPTFASYLRTYHVIIRPENLVFAWHYDLPPIEDANGDSVVAKMAPKHSEDRTNVIYLRDRQIRIADLSQL